MNRPVRRGRRVKRLGQSAERSERSLELHGYALKGIARRVTSSRTEGVTGSDGMRSGVSERAAGRSGKGQRRRINDGDGDGDSDSDRWHDLK